jgi:hypothetical protein
VVVIIAQVTQNMFEIGRAITFQSATTEGEVSSVSGGGSREYGVEELGALGDPTARRDALHISRNAVNWLVGNIFGSSRGSAGRHDWQLQRVTKSANQEGDLFGGIVWHDTSTSGD